MSDDRDAQQTPKDAQRRPETPVDASSQSDPGKSEVFVLDDLRASRCVAVSSVMSLSDTPASETGPDAALPRLIPAA